MTNKELRDFRVKHKLTQRALAEWLGLATITIRKYEYGENKIPKLVEIAIKHYKAAKTG